jgi:hypothetical protein
VTATILVTVAIAATTVVCHPLDWPEAACLVACLPLAMAVDMLRRDRARFELDVYPALVMLAASRKRGQS